MLKSGVEDDIFWSEIGSEFGAENGAAHPHKEFPGVPLGVANSFL